MQSKVMEWIKVCGRPLKQLACVLTIECARFTLNKWVVLTVRKLCNIQLSTEELLCIVKVVRRSSPCNFLVFGMGNDTELWRRINKGGLTCFIEDNEWWFNRMKARSKGVNARLISYPTQRTQWRELLDKPEYLASLLPHDIQAIDWRIVLVDAPAGYKDDDPGRMISIYATSSLAQTDSNIFVHDCDRDVERVYCDRFLGVRFSHEEVGRLRHYHKQ